MLPKLAKLIRHKLLPNCLFHSKTKPQRSRRTLMTSNLPTHAGGIAQSRQRRKTKKRLTRTKLQRTTMPKSNKRKRNTVSTGLRRFRPRTMAKKNNQKSAIDTNMNDFIDS